MNTLATPSIHVRPFDSGDIDALIDIFRSSVRLVARRDYTLEQVSAWAPDEIDAAAWESRCAHRETYVAEIDGLPVGFTELEPDGHIDMMYVHPQRQGRGIASALLARVEAVARRQKLTRIFSESSITARPFFLCRGFSVIVSQVVSVRGRELINYRMEKSLQM